jgi:hypothetical protein
MTNEIEKNIVPDHIIDIFLKKYELYPSFTQTRNVTVDAINVLTKKNKIVWFSKVFDGQNTFIKEALIDYSGTYKIMVYIKSKENEKIYKLIIMSVENSGANVDLLLKGLNKFYTIDLI